MWTVTNGTATNFAETVTGTRYRTTVTPTADFTGDATVSVSADAATDGNRVGNASATETFAVDTLAPALSTATVTGNTLTLTYDEALDGSSAPAASAYEVRAGPPGSLTTVALAATNPVTISGSAVTLTLASAVAPTDTVRVSYTAPGSGAKLQDELGNAAASLTDRAVTNDTAKPTVLIASDATFPTKDAFAVTFAFSADVTGFVAGDVTVANGTASGFSGSGTAYRVTVTPAADVDGDVTVSVSADAARASNGVGNAAASETFAVDTLAPGLSSAAVTGNALTLTYDEALDGSSVPAGADFAVTVDGTTVALAATNPVTISGSAVTLTLAAAVAPTDTVTLSYTAPGSGAKLQDAVGNAAANLTNRAVTNDTVAPTVLIASDATFPTKDPFAVTFAFSADVTGFVAGDVTVANGTASGFSGSGTAYRVTVTPDADYAGDVTVEVSADVAQASNGVGNAAATETFAVDTLAPALSTATVTGNTLTLTYDEALDGSSAPAASAYEVRAGPPGSLTTVALAATNPVTISGSAVTLTLASAVAPTDTVTLSYTAPGSGAKLQDELGNAAASLTDRAVRNDTLAPTVLIASDATFPTKDAFAVTFAFSADVTGFVAGDVTVTKGMASGLTGSGTSYTVTVTPAADYAGDVTVEVPADVAQASNGVGNAAASETFAVDTLAPALSTAAVSGNTLVLTYDEALDGSSVPAGADFAVTVGGTTVALAATNPVSVSGRTVSLTLAAAVAPTDTVTLSYTAPGSGAKLQDELGNAAENLTGRAVTNDTAVPTVAIASDATFPTKDRVCGDVRLLGGRDGVRCGGRDGDQRHGVGEFLKFDGGGVHDRDHPGCGRRRRRDGVGGGGRGAGVGRGRQRGGERDVRGGHAGAGSVERGGDGQRADADLRRGAGRVVGAGGRRFRGDGGRDNGGAGGHEPGDDLGFGGDADAGVGGGADGHGDVELHGAGERREAPGRVGQRGGEPDGSGGDQRHREADGGDRERCDLPDQGRVCGDVRLLGGRDGVRGRRRDGDGRHGVGEFLKFDGGGVHDRDHPGRRRRRRRDGVGVRGRGDRRQRGRQRGGERDVRGGHAGAGSVERGGDGQRADADLRRGAGRVVGAGGRRLRGDGGRDNGGAGGHEPGVGVGADGEPDAGGGGWRRRTR